MILQMGLQVLVTMSAIDEFPLLRDSCDLVVAFDIHFVAPHGACFISPIELGMITCN